MLNLPSDAVVWTHEQSEDILKQKSIPAGSHKGKSNKPVTTRKPANTGGGNGNGRKGGGNGGKGDGNHKKAKKVIEKAGKLNLWWENLARKVDAGRRKLDKLLKDITKTFKTMGATFSSSKTAIQKYTKLLTVQQKNAKAGVKKAQGTLNNLATGKVKKKISYKKGKKTKKKTVNISNYVKFDRESGGYIVDDAKIKEDFKIKKGKNKGKLSQLGQEVGKKANEMVDDAIGKLNKYTDELDKANEEFIQLADNIYETFYSWEKTINNLSLISKRLELLTTASSMYQANIDLQNAKTRNGFITAEELETILKQEMERNVNAVAERIKLGQANIQSSQNEYNRLVNLQTYQDRYNKAIEAGKEEGLDQKYFEAAKGDLEKATIAIELWTKTNGNFEDAKLALTKFNEIDYNSETYKGVEELLNSFNDAKKAILESISTEYEDLKALQDIIEQTNQDMIDFEKELLSGAEELIQENIDKLDKLNDSITNTLKDLLDEVKEKLEARRQQEDNQNTEADISRKRQRLAALRADTSGGHAVEIAQLEKEIADSQQSYQRSLEDQLLDKLQKQGDEAAKQRERIIELQRAQFEIAQSAGVSIAEIEKILANRDKDKARELFRQANNYDKVSTREKKDIDHQFEEAWGNYYANQQTNQLAREQAQSQDIKQAEEEAQTKENEEQVRLEKETYVKPEPEPEPVVEPEPEPQPEPQPTLTVEPPKTDPKKAKIDAYKKELAARKKAKKISTKQVNNLFSLGSAAGYGKATVLKDIVAGKPFTWENVFDAIIDAKGIDRYNLVKTFGYDGTMEKAVKRLKSNPNTISEITKHKKYKSAKKLAYKTGGIADFTGPAWLDGTPSKPELVLNAADTKNFIALKDVLSHAVNSTSGLGEGYGDMTYEININVDKIEKDYDVDKVAERVKKIIVKDSNYRNVTQVRKFR